MVNNQIRHFHLRCKTGSVFVAAACCFVSLSLRADNPPSFWNYDRAASYESLKTHAFVPVRDGTLIGCDLYRPATAGIAAPGKFPGIVAEFTPYFAMRVVGTVDPEANYFAARGYNVLVCDLRGTGDSGGLWPGTVSAVEIADDYDLIEWLATQPWSTGKIGQQGFSYGAFTTYRVASAQPPHLVAIAPIEAQADLYNDNIYPGGIRATPGGTIADWPPIAFAASGGRINPVIEYATYAAHPTWDSYWKQIAVKTKYDRIKVPVLAVGGWDDTYFRNAMVENYQGLKARTWITYGPWEHENPYDYPSCNPCSSYPIPPGALLAWWDRWLMGNTTAPLPATRFTSFENPAGVGEGWQQFSDWPPRDTRFVRLRFTSTGALWKDSDESGTEAFGEPSIPALQDTPLSLVSGALSFTSAQLQRDVVLVDSPLLYLKATLNASDANFYVQLFDVGPDGTAVSVNDGFLKASHKDSHETPTPIVPGQSNTYVFKVYPDHWRFLAGHRIRLTLSGGDPTALLPPLPVTVTVATDQNGSYVSFPFRGNSARGALE